MSQRVRSQSTQANKEFYCQERAQQILQQQNITEASVMKHPKLSALIEDAFGDDAKQAMHAMRYAAYEVAVLEYHRQASFGRREVLGHLISEFKDYLAFDAQQRAEEGKKKLRFGHHSSPYDEAMQYRAAAILKELEQSTPRELEQLANEIGEEFTENHEAEVHYSLLSAALEIAVNEKALGRRFPAADLMHYLKDEVADHLNIRAQLMISDPTKREKADLQAEKEGEKAVSDYIMSVLHPAEKRELCQRLRLVGGNPLHELREIAIEYNHLCERHEQMVYEIHPAIIYSDLMKMVEARVHEHRTGQEMYIH